MTDSDAMATNAQADKAVNKVGQKPVRAIGLLSGGLDSMLAHAVIRAQGIEVRAVNFYTVLIILIGGITTGLGVDVDVVRIVVLDV